MGAYSDILTSSTQYANLESAHNAFNSVSYHIDELARALNESSGQIIEETKEGFNGVGIKLKEYMDKIDDIKQALLANAERMDGVLDDWKRMAAAGEILEVIDSGPTKISERYKDVNPKYSTVLYVYSATRTVIKADTVSIGADGYIEVHTIKETTTYQYETSGGPNVDEIVSGGSVISSDKVPGDVYHFGFSDSSAPRNITGSGGSPNVETHGASEGEGSSGGHGF